MKYETRNNAWVLDLHQILVAPHQTPIKEARVSASS
jgi:hypothetical protein